MCPQKESLYGAIESLKVKISNLLLIAWTLKVDKTNLIQKEKESRINHQICQDDWEVYRYVSDCSISI